MALAPIAPAAPPRLSITIGWPSTFAMPSAAMRPMMSVEPPGGNGMTSALGLRRLLVAPWLPFKLAFLPAALIGLNPFAVARLTRLCAPLLGLRMSASRGDRAALSMLEVHDPAWAKIHAANAEV